MSDIPKARDLITQGLTELAKLPKTSGVAAARKVLAQALSLMRRDREPGVKREPKSKSLTPHTPEGDELAEEIYRDWLENPKDLNREIGHRHGVENGRVYEIAHYPKWQHIRDKVSGEGPAA